MSSVFPSKFAEEVFDDLKNATNELIRHEESTVHKKAIVALLACSRSYKVFAERGLPFRGSTVMKLLVLQRMVITLDC